MVSMGVDAMVLADDVLIVTSGANVTKSLAKALNATHPFLHNMEGKVAGMVERPHVDKHPGQDQCCG